MTVYSTQLFAGESAGSLQTVYTVPTGETVVIRDWRVWNNTTGPVQPSMSILVSGSLLSVIYRPNAPISSGFTDEGSGRIVVSGGQEIAINGPADVFWTISGYVLDG